MYFDINKYIFIFIGWLLRTSYQLECLQCTSPIQRVSSNWDHSCLDGTLKSLPCGKLKLENGTELNYQQCVSAVYRVGQQRISGIMINRHCTMDSNFQHDCDPATPYTDLGKFETFYCSYTCPSNGCNRHLVEDITSTSTSSTIRFLKTNYYIVSIFIYYLIR